MDRSVAVVFGGAGYIGGFLIRHLLNVHQFDQIYVFDIKEPSDWQRVPDVTYCYGDVRKKISLDLPQNINTGSSWIFNFAAIHREPGHEFREYFDTNIPGAENVCDFARITGIQNILFTSSIAPYGRSLYERTEQSPLYPETAYGISKALAEGIHREWLVENESRKLIIVRPSVIYGPGDPGNVYRMINALKKGTFVLPDGGKTIKAYGYVYGLIESMLFTMNKKEKYILYNYAENPVVPLNEMVAIAKNELLIKKATLKLPVRILAVIAAILQIGFKIIGKKSDIHPVRVKKAGFPTNIKPEFLIENGFDFKFPFRESLQHWQKISPEDFK